MQFVKPNAAWEGITPVPMEELYSSILEGRMDLRLPLANGQAPEMSILLSRLVAMPIEQHLQLQVIPRQYGFLRVPENHAAAASEPFRGWHCTAER